MINKDLNLELSCIIVVLLVCYFFEKVFIKEFLD